MPVPKEMSLPVYLRQHNIRHAENIEYDVSAQVDLVCFQAYHLAEMQSQPLHAVHLLKAILHIPGSSTEQILMQQGLTLEKIHATPLNPNDPPFACDQLFEKMIQYADRSAIIGMEHLLLALLEEEVLKPYFAAWQINLEAFRSSMHAGAS
jgi:hypothetical protein